ncbi:hypothetical protein G3I60_21455 [Streptomyces sp. SID13666]|uniref:hypothetical protein n=1 Tax=unclassified Streptomyces TaxID=2593676 RepID=UPI0013BFDFEF|nr:MULTISPECIES: hypothetical protein [unclassified Streptomyces]NEA56633.1 hypothetical protein [Streptomyces sp. SID13666]NEA73077.1 hypothetical protein [Streptomyces sp. SID13588]
MTPWISSEFPTGNGLISQVGTYEFVVDRDLRDSTGDRWYWHVRLHAERDALVRIRLARPLLIGQFGPVVSRAGTRDWLWASPGPDTAFDVPLPGRTTVGLSATMAYGLQELEAFRAKLGESVVWQSLTGSEGGSDVPVIIVPHPKAENLVLLTARHHACEAMASYVLEGAVQEFIELRRARDPSVSRCELMAAPIMDMDGVTRGDQGKARKPWDHNRDYGVSSTYRSVSALRNRLAADGRNTYALDLHTPGLRGPMEEVSYVVSSGDPGDYETAQGFLGTFNSLHGGCDFKAPEVLLFDHDWNSASSLSQRCCSAWLRSRKDTRIALTIEYPNAVVQGVPVTEYRARMFGALLLRTLIAQM